MQGRPQIRPAAPQRETLSVERLQAEAEAWVKSSRRRGHSEQTVAEKVRILDKFFWFAQREGFEVIGADEIDAYLEHVQNGHTEPKGRFEHGERDPRAFRKASANTYRYHWDTLAAWFTWQTEKSKCWIQNPFEMLEPAGVPEDTDVKPFSEAEIECLLVAARKSFIPTRDYAILRLLLDTGIRASELCGIRVGDIDEKDQSINILGKGNKRRLVYFGAKTGRALWKHLDDMGAAFGETAISEHSPVFCSERGPRAGEALAPRALYDIVQSVAKRAGVPNAHPHRFRHTFAVNFLRNGGNQISLMRLLGHTSLSMTAHYVALVQADLEEQHRKFSPGDRVRG
jgi:integrase/recombinase XerD